MSTNSNSGSSCNISQRPEILAKNRGLNPYRRSGLNRLGLFSPLALFDDSLPNVFADFFGEGQTSADSLYIPNVNLTETDKEYLVNCDLPGLTEKDVQITLEDEGIKISGERRHTEEKKEGSKVIHSETRYGKFERFIGFDSSIDSSKIDATLKNGQLKIVIPKIVKDQIQRKIEVKTG